MREWRNLPLWLAWAMIGASAVPALFFPAEDPEPSYRGQSLSDLLLIPSYREQRKALTAIGTNAVPWLMRWVQYETPPLKAAYYTRASGFLVGRGLGVRDKRSELGDRAAGWVYLFAADDPALLERCQAMVRDPETSLEVRRRMQMILIMTRQEKADRRNAPPGMNAHPDEGQ